ncbi:putative RNA methylase [Kribbella flavida DSM 17836]|uniref:Putative RNA methylase n=1 Tax=Kribbella flavida (strain DSM 17836 / JCM 10339 / NBRC 14399) TaxID=479435 RepID=D2PR68_KRIFD|nr:methyltransferase domain-containing protein [Kribbella flavida]ADB33016.1 putative RNA methylase [Kribbella flavida DSM 17836]
MSHPVLDLPCLALDQPVRDHVVLRTVAGAEDLITGLDVIAGSPARLTCRVDGALRELHDLRLFSTLAVLVPDTTAVLRSATSGVTSALRSETPLRFRIAPATPDHDALNVALVNELGWLEDPGDWTVNFVGGPNGWEAEIGPFHWSRRFGRLDRLPWSTKPVVAEVLTRLAKLRPGHRVLDPFCGTGTLLAAASAAVGAPVILLGSDLDPRAIALAGANLSRLAIPADLPVASAESLDHAEHSVDRVIANLPFGKLVGSHAGNAKLYPAALREIARLLPRSGRAVLLTDDKRLFEDAVARTRGLKIVRRRVLGDSGVTPTAYVLTLRR